MRQTRPQAPSAACRQLFSFGCDLLVRRQLKPLGRLGRVGQDEHAARVGGKLVAAVRESRVSVFISALHKARPASAGTHR